MYTAVKKRIPKGRVHSHYSRWTSPEDRESIPPKTWSQVCLWRQSCQSIAFLFIHHVSLSTIRSSMVKDWKTSMISYLSIRWEMNIWSLITRRRNFVSCKLSYWWGFHQNGDRSLNDDDRITGIFLLRKYSTNSVQVTIFAKDLRQNAWINYQFYSSSQEIIIGSISMVSMFVEVETKKSRVDHLQIDDENKHV